MEELTKQQLILLALLVSFVTSIATGIATVSLVDQAPPGVTQTIHKVVERTVETVVPDSFPTKTVVQETTVVVREEDLLTESIASVGEQIVRIYQDIEDIEIFSGIGVLSSTDGLIVTSSETVLNNGNTTFRIVLPDGTSLEAVRREQGVSSVVVLAANTAGLDVVFTPVISADLTLSRLGQTAFTVGGEQADTVAMGIVSNITKVLVDDVEVVQQIDVSMVTTTPGEPVVNIFGEVMGLAMGVGTSSFIPISRVNEALSELGAQVLAD